VLAAFFAVLVVIVLIDAIRVWINVLKAPTPPPTTEDPATKSELWAPSGLFATTEEREIMRSRERESVEAGT